MRMALYCLIVLSAHVLLRHYSKSIVSLLTTVITLCWYLGAAVTAIPCTLGICCQYNASFTEDFSVVVSAETIISRYAIPHYVFWSLMFVLFIYLFIYYIIVHEVQYTHQFWRVLLVAGQRHAAWSRWSVLWRGDWTHRHHQHDGIRLDSSGEQYWPGRDWTTAGRVPSSARRHRPNDVPRHFQRLPNKSQVRNFCTFCSRFCWHKWDSCM